MHAGTFTFVEIDLAGLVAPSALEPFTKELSARQRRREDRAHELARRRLQEAAQEAALASVSAAPNAAELLVTPPLAIDPVGILCVEDCGLNLTSSHGG